MLEKLIQNVKHCVYYRVYESKISSVSGTIDKVIHGVWCACGWSKGDLNTFATTKLEGEMHLSQQKSTSKKLIYLASPHSHTSAAIRKDRYKAALGCTEWLFRNKFWVFSPIVHSHLFYGKLDKGEGWDFWIEYDTEMITRCDEVWVLQIPGWQESKGVQAEIKIAKLQGKKVFGIKPRTSLIDYEVDYEVEEMEIK